MAHLQNGSSAINLFDNRGL